MTELNDAQAIIDVALSAAKPVPLDVGGFYAALVPQGYTVATVDDRDNADRRKDHPQRRRGTATLTRAESFTAYVLAAQSPNPPALYADDEHHRITAVFNGPYGPQPGWGDDKAVLGLVTTPEWREWTGMDRNPVSQKVFAEFLEDHVSSVKAPDGATLLEMVTTFEAMTNVEVQSVTRLGNGTRQLVWKETIQAKAGQTGDAEFPDAFLLELVPFKGMAPVTIGARLRYSVTRDKGLQLTFLLDDTDTILRDAFDVVLAAVEQDTGLVAYHGTPPA